MDKVVSCLDRQLPRTDPEVTLHQTLKKNIKSIRAVKWYKRPFSKKTAKRETVDEIRQAIWDYVEAKADSIYDGFNRINTSPNPRTSLRSLNTSATSVSTTTFDAHIDLLGGQSESNNDQCTDAPRRIVYISPNDPDKVIDFLQLECDKNREDSAYHSRCIKCLYHMTRYHGILPTSFSYRHARRIGAHPIWGGGFADIWKGRMNGELICIKVPRVFMDNGIEEWNKMIKDFCREALVWRNLYHPSILPFLGVSRHLFAPSFCLISPWMEYGNIMACLKERPQQIQRLTAVCSTKVQFLDPQVDATLQISQVAEGIAYLHSLNPPIVHADIRGANILVKDDLSCCLSDFGLALAVESQIGASSSSRAFLGGSLHVYSFGCTVIEIYTGKPPFSYIRKEAAIIHEVLTRGKRPDKPADILDWTWGLVSKCLVSPASRRPTAQAMVNTLTLGLNV
ncbi:kinase-like domain-containing protein [Armillaria mellea]|nr:kinase-like domain-containing protein [Armillaria mellea]